MEIWFLLALTTLICWGLWGFFSKLAVNHIKPKSALLYEIGGEFVIGIILLLAVKPALTFSSSSLIGILAGLAMLSGILTFFIALKKGKLSLVVPLTALYPLIAIFFAFLLLGEKISIIQGSGILLALIAAYLLGS